jgi:hypothetical protein
MLFGGPPTLTLPHKGGGDSIECSLSSPSPLMGEGGEGVTLFFELVDR